MLYFGHTLPSYGRFQKHFMLLKANLHYSNYHSRLVHFEAQKIFFLCNLERLRPKCNQCLTWHKQNKLAWYRSSIICIPQAVLQNATAYLPTTVNYARKMFLKSSPARLTNVEQTCLWKNKNLMLTWITWIPRSSKRCSMADMSLKVLMTLMPDSVLLGFRVSREIGAAGLTGKSSGREGLAGKSAKFWRESREE